MSNIIEVAGFTKRFGEFVAVDNISFHVEEGTIFSFLGPNGAGKSTTIGALSTMLEKTAGSLRICGYEVSRHKDKIREAIGIVFQESTLDTRLTVEENLAFHCEFYNVPKIEIREKIDYALNLVDLQQWRKAPVAGLSGGMKRRVEIARGLVHCPRVLFLDEPTQGLDPQTRAHIWEYIVKLQKQNHTTVFLTTHYMDEAEISDKVAIIDHGRIVAFDTPHNLKKQHASRTVRLRTNDAATLANYLTQQSIAFTSTENPPADTSFTVHPTKLDQVLDMAGSLRDTITDLEITNGTLNDVFLAITGREIRE